MSMSPAADGTLVPITAVTKISNSTSPLAVNHFGQLPAVTISFSLPPGIALSDAVTKLNGVEAQIGLPASVQGSFQGTAKAFQDSTRGMGLLLFGAVVVVYIVLGILYESFIHPLTILSGLPSAAVGALITLWLFKEPLTLYAFVGMIMLVGIVKKNAIMMIDFALAREREHGASPMEAITEAALIRFRPIMMTTMAALMGTLPIAIGLRPGRRRTPAAGPRGGRRAGLEPGADALHHAGDLRLSRQGGRAVRAARFPAQRAAVRRSRTS